MLDEKKENNSDNSENGVQSPEMTPVFDQNHVAPATDVVDPQSPSEGALVDFKFSAIKPQIASFRLPVEGGVAELVFSIDGLSDDVLAQVGDLIVSKQRMENDSIIFENDDLAAACWFFDNCVILTEGFEGELPADWRKEFDPSDKQNVSRQFLYSTAIPNRNVEIVKKFVFGAKKVGKKVQVRAIYNNRKVDLFHELPANYNSYLAEFKKITETNERKRGDDAVSARPVSTELGELYDKMNVKTVDYDAGVVPLNHKDDAMREAFSSDLQDQVKK